MRSACATCSGSSMTAPSTSNQPALRRARRPMPFNPGPEDAEDTIMTSERGNIEEETLQPAHGLDLVHHALATVLDAGVGHLGRGHGTAAGDGTRIHDPREAHIFAAAVDGDLLFTSDLQIAIGQHADHGSGQGSAEDIGRAAGTLAVG